MFLRYACTEYVVFLYEDDNSRVRVNAKSYGQLLLRNPGGSSIGFVAVDDADLPTAKKSTSSGVYYPVSKWQFSQMVDTVRNESPIQVEGSTDANPWWALRTWDEGVGEEEGT